MQKDPQTKNTHASQNTPIAKLIKRFLTFVCVSNRILNSVVTCCSVKREKISDKPEKISTV